MKYYCKLEPDTRIVGRFSVDFPDFYCCVSQGNNLKHALEMAKEALSLQLQGDLAEGLLIPEPSNHEGKKGYYGIEVDSEIADRIKTLQKNKKTITVH